MNVVALFAVLLVISTLVRVDALAPWSWPGYAKYEKEVLSKCWRNICDPKEQGRSAAPQSTSDESSVGECWRNFCVSGNDGQSSVGRPNAAARSPAQATGDDYAVGSTGKDKNNIRGQDQGRSAASHGTADGSRVGGRLVGYKGIRRSGNVDQPAAAPSPGPATVDGSAVGSTRKNINNLRVTASGNGHRGQNSRFYNGQRGFGYSPKSRRTWRSRASYSRFSPK